VSKYPVEQVISAIETFTAATTGPEIVTDSTLESILSVVYYPEHLIILRAITIPTWRTIADQYLSRYSVGVIRNALLIEF